MRQAERLGTFAANSPQWHAARAAGLGGSEIAAVMGLSPWCSRFTLWHRKAGLIEEESDNAGMSWGRRLEDVIAQKFAEDHPEFRVRRSGTWRSVARPWQIANPDRLLYGADGDIAIYEGKTAHAMHADMWGRPGTDNIPVYYRTQTLWYLDTFGYTTCHLAVLIGGSDYREYIVRYDAAEAELMRTFGAEFMASLAANDRPPIDESDSTYQAVRSLNPHIEDRHKEVPEDIAVRYITACGVERDAKAAKQRASSELLDAMGAARYAVHQGQRIAMRAVKGDNTPYLRAIQLKE